MKDKKKTKTAAHKDTKKGKEVFENKMVKEMPKMMNKGGK